MVKRYDADGTESATGYLVPYQDYDSLERERGGLREALEGLLSHYRGMVNSGDCGCWNPEEEDVVIASVSALAKGADHER